MASVSVYIDIGICQCASGHDSVTCSGLDHPEDTPSRTKVSTPRFCQNGAILAPVTPDATVREEKCQRETPSQFADTDVDLPVTS